MPSLDLESKKSLSALLKPFLTVLIFNLCMTSALNIPGTSLISL